MNPQKNRRILIIDDNPSIHADFRKILSPSEALHSGLDVTEEALFGSETNKNRQIPFELDSAYQGQEGVEAVKKALQEGRPYAMAFVDVRMPPGWDGVETTQKIWEINPETQIVICTAYSDYSWEEMFAAIGNDDRMVVLKKPFDTVEALQLAHALTEKWWLSRQSKQKIEDLEEMVAERTSGLRQANEELQIEIDKRKKNEQKLNVEYAISRVLAEASTVEEAASQVLQSICENLSLDVGELWIVDPRESVLRWAEMWSAPNLQVDEFKTVSRQMTFARGIGLAGRVWDSGRPAWISDIAENADFPRSAVAGKAGLHSFLGFPVLIENEVFAIIGLFSREPQAPDDSLLLIAAALGNQIGQFFQRTRLEVQLFQSQKLETVGKLAGGIAHEFNNIMTAIIGQSELLLGDLPPENPLSKNAIEIRDAANRAAALTRQLLAYGRKQILQPEALNLNDIIANMESMFRHLMGDGVDVRIHPAPNLKPVNADAGQIEQVIMNMAMNARDAMPHRGKFTLETGTFTLDEKEAGRYPELKPGDYVMLAISDTGSGMSTEVKQRVFEPFFSTKGVGQGTGLGLATCYGIIKQSGGHITVHSEPDQGTTFKIYLPRMRQEVGDRPVSRQSSDLPLGTETVLLVEGDQALCNMISALLGRLGYIVLAAANSVEALNLIKQQGNNPVDLLFMDEVIPQESGKELSDRVLELYPKTKILFTSAYTENAIVHQGVSNSGAAVLQKPFSPSALAQKVRKILDVLSTS
jgi:two-component system, cell cycle sensor histidine kinase and response regulator CckA